MGQNNCAMCCDQIEPKPREALSHQVRTVTLSHQVRTVEAAREDSPPSLRRGVRRPPDIDPRSSPSPRDCSGTGFGQRESLLLQDNTHTHNRCTEDLRSNFGQAETISTSPREILPRDTHIPHVKAKVISTSPLATGHLSPRSLLAAKGEVFDGDLPRYLSRRRLSELLNMPISIQQQEEETLNPKHGECSPQSSSDLVEDVKQILSVERVLSPGQRRRSTGHRKRSI
mmetsp:Transcript_13038/g.26072  ORF Transcript_13038/g.26072 Transcript_13038/m.26072 type:complete len:228 (-) Transcript_13038:425-1108(-)